MCKGQACQTPEGRVKWSHVLQPWLSPTEVLIHVHMGECTVMLSKILITMEGGGFVTLLRNAGVCDQGE